MSVGLILVLISSISGFFPVVTALYNYRHLDNVLKIAALFFLITSVFDPAMWLLAKSGSRNTMWMLHLNVLVSLSFYTIIYYKLFIKPIHKKITIAVAIITLFIMLYFNRSLDEYPSVSNTTLSVQMILLSLIYFYQLLNPLKFIDIEKQSLFWINAGVLIYYSVNIFLFMIFTQIPVDDRHNYYIINSITNIIANILFSVGLFCKPQKTT